MWAPVPRPRSSQDDGQVWKECVCWQELDSAQAKWKSCSYPPLSALEECGRWGMFCGEGCRASHVSLSPPPLINTCQQWNLGARGVPRGEGRATCGRQGSSTERQESAPLDRCSKEHFSTSRWPLGSSLLTLRLEAVFASISRQTRRLFIASRWVSPTWMSRCCGSWYWRHMCPYMHRGQDVIGQRKEH